MKKCYRFFGGMLSAQEKWLNSMAEQGYRLVRTEKLLYEFEVCQPGQVQYRVEFISEKSKRGAKQYHDFLEEMGYRVFYKNINLNYAVGKVRWRPWAEQGGRLATHATTFDRELLIVEKVSDGKPFELHTTVEDRQQYYRKLREPYLWLASLAAVMGIVTRSWLWGVFAFILLAPLAVYQRELTRLKREARLRE